MSSRDISHCIASSENPCYRHCSDDVTHILEALGHGDRTAADELLPLVYQDLRKLAALKMAGQAPGHTLQPTALVHEAWLRLAGNQPGRFAGRAHFYVAAAEAMRHILIDSARRKRAARHGGGQVRVDIEDVQIASLANDDELLAVHDVLVIIRWICTSSMSTRTCPPPWRAARFRRAESMRICTSASAAAA